MKHPMVPGIRYNLFEAWLELANQHFMVYSNRPSKITSGYDYPKHRAVEKCGPGRALVETRRLQRNS